MLDRVGDVRRIPVDDRGDDGIGNKILPDRSASPIPVAIGNPASVPAAVCSAAAIMAAMSPLVGGRTPDASATSRA